MAEQPRYVLDLYLVNGTTVVSPYTEEEVETLAASGQFVSRTGGEVDPLSALFTIVAHGQEDVDGLFVVVDENGRVWGIPGRAILAFSILDRTAPRAHRQLGFNPRLDLRHQ